jgi:hypothetical protein
MRSLTELLVKKVQKIKNGILVMFLLRLIRAEHYFNGGLFFFG